MHNKILLLWYCALILRCISWSVCLFLELKMYLLTLNTALQKITTPTSFLSSLASLAFIIFFFTFISSVDLSFYFSILSFSAKSRFFDTLYNLDLCVVATVLILILMLFVSMVFTPFNLCGSPLLILISFSNCMMLHRIHKIEFWISVAKRFNIFINFQQQRITRTRVRTAPVQQLLLLARPLFRPLHPNQELL